jgi:rubrerythrin
VSDAAATSRREALRTAAIGAGLVAAGGLVRPVAAVAQSTDDEDLRDFLAEAIALEQIGVLAYALASEAKGVDARTRRLFERLRDQDQAHANAFRQAIDSLGFDASDAPADPEDSGVYDDAEGIDDELAKELSDLLARLAEPKNLSEWLGLLLEIERREIRFYLVRAPALDSADLAITSAEIAANQAQHVIALETAAGTEPIEALVSLEVAAGAKPGA